MFKIIKKELEDIKNHKEHMEYVPPYTLNPKDNFDEFIKLTTRSNARFKVRGDYKNFVIQASSDKWLFVILFVIMFFFMTLALSEDFTNPMYWLVIIVILTTVIITFRYYPSSNNVNINSYNKTITICNNNLIGKYIVPKITSVQDKFQ